MRLCSMMPAFVTSTVCSGVRALVLRKTHHHIFLSGHLLGKGFIIHVLRGKATSLAKKYGVFLSSPCKRSGSGMPSVLASKRLLRDDRLTCWRRMPIPPSQHHTSPYIAFESYERVLSYRCNFVELCIITC